MVILFAITIILVILAGWVVLIEVAEMIDHLLSDDEDNEDII